MRSHQLTLLALIFSILCSCGTKPNPKNSKQELATEAETEVKLNETLQRRVGSWAKEGAECYGLVLLLRRNNKVEHGKSVKSVIVRMKSDSLKVKVLENISLAKIKDCEKMGMSVGDTWWEKEGDLFLTREEADNFLKAKGWEFKDKKKGSFKIGK